MRKVLFGALLLFVCTPVKAQDAASQVYYPRVLERRDVVVVVEGKELKPDLQRLKDEPNLPYYRCYFRKENNLNDDERKLMRAILDPVSQSLLAWGIAPTDERTPSGYTKGDNDWRRTRMPDGLSEGWQSVFWSLVRKRRDHCKVFHAYWHACIHKQQDEACAEVGIKPDRTECEKNMRRFAEIDAKVEEWLREKPPKLPGGPWPYSVGIIRVEPTDVELGEPIDIPPKEHEEEKEK